MFFFAFFLSFSASLDLQASSEAAPTETKSEDTGIKVYKGGWFNWDPYQYLRVPGDKTSLTGLDVELEKIIFKKIGADVVIDNFAWKDHQESLKTGERDFGAGAFTSKERAKYSYISTPYRFEENSLFTLRYDSRFNLESRNMGRFIHHVKENNLRIGVIDGYLYGNPQLNEFIADPGNARYLKKSGTDNQNLSYLLAGKIDGFLADRIVGATIIWREKVGSKVNEHRLDSKAPVHLLLSKKSFTEKQVAEINQAIEDLKKTNEYTETVSWYIYPILLLETTDSQWFEFIQTLAIVAFAVSGVALAYRHNTSLFGAFIIALIPSFGGGILRDVIFGRYPIWFLSAKVYMFALLFIVICGFYGIKISRYLIQRYSIKAPRYLRYSATNVFNIVIMVADAIGLAAFTVVGVIVSLIVKADPLWLWGPFFAFLSGAGGSILRDIVLKEASVEVIHGDPYAEITIFWGGVLSIYLTYAAYDVDPLKIKMSVILTILCAFLTRLIVYFYKIPNVFFINHRFFKNKRMS